MCVECASVSPMCVTVECAWVCLRLCVCVECACVCLRMCVCGVCLCVSPHVRVECACVLLLVQRNGTQVSTQTQDIQKPQHRA